MNTNTALIAQLAKLTPNALITTVNSSWGRYGSGSPKFWEIYGAFIFRDSIARALNEGQLQSLDGVYDLLATPGLSFEYKGDIESRTRSELVGQIVAGPARAERVDSPAAQIPLRPGYDPTGRIRQVVVDHHMAWGEFLPQVTILRLMVNGRISTKHPTQTCYDGLSLFHASHPVNPLDKANAAVYPNTFTLGAAVDEAAWADLRDKIMSTPSFNGKLLPHARMSKPLIVVATEAQALRWMRFLGGPNATRDFHLQPVAGLAISSVSLGTGDIVVDPYLLQEAENKTTIVKRGFVFPRTAGVPAPIIYREEQPPKLSDSGETGFLVHDRLVREIGCSAWVTAVYGEPRSVFEVIEP